MTFPIPDVPTWALAAVIGFAAGLALQTVKLRRMYRVLDVSSYSDEEFADFMKFVQEEVDIRAKEKAAEVCPCGDRLADCSTCPRRDPVDAHEEKA